MPLRKGCGLAPGRGMGWRLGWLGIAVALCLSVASGAGVPVFLSGIQLETTHDWFLETPLVYFRCEGEPKHYLTNVVSAHKQYNFTAHESFQPLTVLEVPKCKRCGLYEEDFFTRDDTFGTLELCPLDFSEPPEGTLVWEAPRQANVTFSCLDCNTRNSFAGGVVFSSHSTVDSHFLSIFAIALGSALGVSIGVAWAIYCFKENGWLFHRPADEDAKFMEIFDHDEEDEFLDEDEFQVEMGECRAEDKRND